MQLAELITKDRIACDIDASSKKRALERLSELISKAQQGGLTTLDVFNSLLARERLGATGVGHGVALPHGRLKNSTQPVGAFIKLKAGVDFDAADKQPVDLMFALLVPEGSNAEHLQLLAQLAQLFRDETMRAKLRATTNVEALYQLFLEWQKTH